MLLRAINTFISILLCLLLIYTPLLVAQDNQLSLPSGDLVAPDVKHEPIRTTFSVGDSIHISATVTDNVGVKSVLLFYRPKGSDGEYNRQLMTRDGTGDVFSTDVTSVDAPAIEYYIQASDLAGNTLLHGHSFSPLSVAITQPSSPSSTSSEEPIVATNEEANESTLSKNKWIWIGLGVIAAGALASGGGGGGGGGDDNNTGTVTINASAPQN